MEAEFKICPECRVEYQTRAHSCADCAVPLIWASQATTMIPPETLDEASWENYGPGEILGELVADHEYVIKAYLGHLKEAGIRSAVLPATSYQTGETYHEHSVAFGRVISGGEAGQVPVGTVLEGYEYILFVSQADYERADAVIDEVFEGLHPGQHRGLTLEFDIGACPACGCGVDEAAVECPDCGLSLG